MGVAKIVVVDDDQDIRDSVQVILEQENYQVYTAADINEGMECIQKVKPDLAILDIMLETWSDGFEMSRELRKDPELKHMRILMLTGVKDKTGIEFKSTAGDPVLFPVDGYLEKPVDVDVLVTEVKRLLQKDI